MATTSTPVNSQADEICLDAEASEGDWMGA
jgi:hypothetical protein